MMRGTAVGSKPVVLSSCGTYQQLLKQTCFCEMDFVTEAYSLCSLPYENLGITDVSGTKLLEMLCHPALAIACISSLYIFYRLDPGSEHNTDLCSSHSVC